jgi:formyl-CoA transferase/CoA:oxalate CoA-transferase
VFATADGELMIAAANDGLFARLCTAIGRPELVDDPRFRTNPDRLAHREELLPLIREPLARRTSAEWLAALEGIPVAPVQDVAQAARHEQTRASGMVQELDGVETVALPLRVDGSRVGHRSVAPAIGAQSAEVLAELGYSADEIDDLAAAGVTRLT